jgi:simple sugar transport system substrate-binding protein
VRTAISQGVDVIAVPDWVPDSEDEAIKAAMKAGIPVMLYNAGGGDKAKELGAINYIGNEEYPAGLAGGRYLAKHGAKHVLCVMTVPSAQNHQDRCRGIADGMKESGLKSTPLPLPPSSYGNPTAVAEATKATLLKDGTIDACFVTSSADADAMANGIKQAGKTKTVKLGSFDMNIAGLNRIKSGEQLFAIDQQPWLQGFLAVSMSEAYVSYALELATVPVLTGPGIVDKSNVDAVMAGGKKGYR